MLSFDDVIPALLRVSATIAGAASVTKWCVVRDLLGRVRLALDCDPCRQPAFDRQDYERRLTQELERYFAGPVVYTDDSQPERRRLAQSLFSNADAWPEGWPVAVEDPITGTVLPLEKERWRAIRRTLSKESWLSASGNTPWPRVSESGKPLPTPTIVSFYSYKGGVGRTTLLAVVARHLASRGLRCVVIDLDLEAPGASTFLEADSPSGRGVLDFLVDYVVAGRADIHGLYGQPATLPPQEAQKIQVFPAGRIDRGYLEKLGRLDFAAQLPEMEALSPAHAALVGLLRKIRADLQPDFILIDSRAGIHDLGGLSLHALAHVDVLVSRAMRQAYPGIALALQTLRQRRGVDDLNCLLVHTFAPLPADDGVGKAEREAFRHQTHTLFQKYVYAYGNQDSPQEEDDTALHYPWVIPLYTELERAQTIADVPATVYAGTAVRAVAERLLALSLIEMDTSDQEDADA